MGPLLPRADRWLPRRVEHLTIRAWLDSPLAWDPYDGITLDGALQFVVVGLETGLMPDDAFAGYRGPKIDIPIPIADVELDGAQIALVSWAQPHPEALEDVRFRRRRLRTDAIGGDLVVRMNQGSFKTTQLPTPTLATPYVDFHADGDLDLLRILLSDVAAIGRARAGGLGRILGFELLSRAGSALVRDGRLTRTVPVDTVDDVDPSSYVIREATTRAPYWHRGSRRLCWVPEATA